MGAREANYPDFLDQVLVQLVKLVKDYQLTDKDGELVTQKNGENTYYAQNNHAVS